VHEERKLFGKWKLMLTTLPLVILISAAKALLEFVFHFEGVVEFSDIGVVLTGAVFLTGFLLSGTMADYKESERLPAELSTALETIEELCVLAVTQRPTIVLKPLVGQVATTAEAIDQWLFKKVTTSSVLQALSDLNQTVVFLEKNGAGQYGSKIVPQLLVVRKTVARIDVVSRTGFLAPAYALLEVLLAVILVLLMVAKFKSNVAAGILVPFVALVNIYMLRLIRDIDNPFDYRPDGKTNGGAEVELFPLQEYRQRLAARIQNMTT
jgi:hypothetical protein